jgi:uncharacterized protein (TIGR03437 family)
VTAISPGGFATIYGSNFASDGTVRTLLPSDFVNGNLPTKLAGVCVQVGGLPAFVTLVVPGQVNFQVPNVPVDSTVNVQVVTDCGGPNEQKSPAVAVATKAATPEVLYWVASASGKNPIIAVNAVTYSYIGAVGLIPGVSFAPAKPGDILTLYGISFGPTAPPVAPGAPPPAIASTTNVAGVKFGSSTITALYSGLSQGSAGLYQLNIQVPAGLADGDYPVVLTLGTSSTPTGGYITVKN